MAKFKVSSNSEIFLAGTSMGTFIDTMSNPAGQEFAALDVTSFTDSAEKFIIGIEMAGEFTVSGHWDDVAGGPDHTFGTLIAGSAVGTFYPVGNNSGGRKYVFDFIMTGFNIVTAVKERVSYEATFQVNSVVTRSVVA